MSLHVHEGVKMLSRGKAQIHAGWYRGSSVGTGLWPCQAGHLGRIPGCLVIWHSASSPTLAVGTLMLLVVKLCSALCNSMNCSMPCFPVLHYLPEFAQTHVHLSWRCHPTISPFVVPFASCLQSFPASGSFPVSWLFASDGQSIGWAIFEPQMRLFFRTGLRIDSYIIL